jgi:hypothetical protein
VTWQGFCKYLVDKDRPWKYAEYDDWRLEDIQALVDIATMENFLKKCTLIKTKDRD